MERFQLDINGPPKFVSYLLSVSVLKTRCVFRIVLFVQEYVYYLQEGNEICYNIFSTPLKKDKKQKNVHFSVVIYFVYNVNCHFYKT